MRSRTRYRAVLILLFGALLLIGPGMRYAEAGVPSATSGDSAYRSGELLIKFKPHVRAVERQAVQTLARVGAERTGELSALGVERWQIPAGQETALAEKLNALPDVEFAEPNYLVRAHLAPDDTYYNLQWAHTVINSPAAWDLTTGSGAVTVAVIDTGVDLQNAELQGRLTAGWDYVNDDDDPDDDHWHGTHVAGVIAATGNNHQGIAGMAWQTLIMPMKVLDNTGSGTDADTAKAITDAVDNGADIINISLGGVDGSQTLYNAVKYAYNHGVLVVASGGNCGDVNYERNGCSSENQTIYPAAYDTEVFAVAATSDYDVVATFSNRGGYIDVAAPGTDIYSTVLNNGFWWASGTSQAAPHVSGLAALLLAIDPTLTAQEIQTHIETASVDLGTPDWDPAYGAGRIDAYAALVHTNITLSPPTLLAIDNADRDGSFWVDWPNVTYATSYTLEEDDNESFSSPVTVYSESASQTQITGQSTGTWYYRARAVRASIDLTSEWSNTGSVKVGLDTPTLNPINNAGSANYTVTWNAADGATAYRLQESASADFSGATTHDMGANLSYNVVEQDGGIWFYRLQATTGVVDSNWSATRSAVVLPDPPQLHAVVAGSEPDAYAISWSSSTGATTYRLHESADDGFTDVITRYLGADTGYTVTGQRAGTWTYRVEAANLAGFSAPSNSRSVTVTVAAISTPLLYPIPDPDDTDTYTVTWSTVPTATYILEQNDTPWFSAPTTAYTGTLTQYVVASQQPGTWHYRVRARTPDGDSPWSTTESVSVWAFTYLPVVLR